MTNTCLQYFRVERREAGHFRRPYLPLGAALDGGEGDVSGCRPHAGEAQPVDDDGVDHRHDGHRQPAQHHRHQRPVGPLGRQALVALAATCMGRGGVGNSRDYMCVCSMTAMGSQLITTVTSVQ